MSGTPWDFVNNCVNGSDSLEGYATFPTNRTISSNPRMIGVLKQMNCYEWSSVPENIRALVTKNVLKKYPRYPYRYVKNFKSAKIKDNENVMMVCDRLKCSPSEALEYLNNNMISEKTLNKWKDEGFYK